jgi:CelD/BcsL family acetyltransferase involved in cellulose biosynthesis
VQISVIHPDDLGPAEIARWHSLQVRTDSLANPFLSPEFTVAVGRLRPSARVAVLNDGPAITGFFPFERRKLGVGVPIAAGLTDCQGLICAPGADWDPRMLLRACGISVWQFDHLAAGQQLFQPYQAAVLPSPVIDLVDGFDAYCQELQASSPRFGKDVARKARKLARDAGEVRLVTDSRDIDALRSLMAWKSDQYRRTGRVDRFSRPWIVALLEALLDTRSDHFSSILSVLYAGDAPVAAHFGMRFERVLAYWFPSYDTSYAAYSPGAIHNLRMVEAAAAAGIELIDLGKGAKRYKETMKSRDIFVAEGVVTRRSPLAAAHWARGASTAWAIRQIRSHPPLFSAFDSVFRRYGEMRSSLSGGHVVRPLAGGVPRKHEPAERVMSPP